MIHTSPILSAKPTYTGETITSVYVEFIDETNATYSSEDDMNAVWEKIVEQMRQFQ